MSTTCQTESVEFEVPACDRQLPNAEAKMIRDVSLEHRMAVRPLYKAQEVNAAAREVLAADLAATAPDPHALHVVNNWRGAHDYPLNGLHMTLKNRATRLVKGKRAFTAQRIKRLESILYKLRDKESMKLSQMQDIGGCRVVMPTLRDVLMLRDLYESSPVVHEAMGSKDYISAPNPDSGYRSLHLKFRFKGSATAEPWNGLKIEIQIRTALQHQWATAVEAAGTMKDQALKSKRGDPEWLRFFKLVSSAFAHREGVPTVANTPDSLPELCREIRAMDSQHHFTSTLSQYAAIIPHVRGTTSLKGAHYLVMMLDPIKREAQVWPFMKDESTKSANFLADLEQETKKPAQVVRVALSSIKDLERAYPNYFLDTSQFLAETRALVALPG